MTSKFAIKSILAVSLVFMLSVMSTTADAIVSSTTVSGCTTTKKLLGQCTIFVDGLLKGLGNVINNPTAFTATMFQMQGKAFCKNPASNSLEGNGVPFTTTTIISSGDSIGQQQVSRNGKALSEITFEDPAIIAAINDPVEVIPPCQHSNWVQIVIITRMQIVGQQWEDPSPNDPDHCLLTGPSEGLKIDTTCVLVDTLRTSCRLQSPYFEDPLSAIGKSYTYGNELTGTGSCTEICHSNDPTGTACNLTTPPHSYPQ